MPRSTKRTGRRKRDHLLPAEFNRLLDAAATTGSHGLRNRTMVLMAFRHGLKLGELTDLRWKMVDFRRKLLRLGGSAERAKYPHPLAADEIKALKQLKELYPPSPNVFVSDYGEKLAERSASRIIFEAGEAAGFKFQVTSNMLRHGCGYALARAGHNIVAIQHYLGLNDIRRVRRYVELPDQPFKGFWK